MTRRDPSRSVPPAVITTEPSVRVCEAPGTTHVYTAIVELHGEHDLATADGIARALAQIEGSVLLDLSACEYLDSTVIRVLLEDVGVRGRAQHRLDVVVPPANAAVARTLELAGVAELLSIRHARPAGAGC